MAAPLDHAKDLRPKDRDLRKAQAGPRASTLALFALLEGPHATVDALNGP